MLANVAAVMHVWMDVSYSLEFVCVCVWMEFDISLLVVSVLAPITLSFEIHLICTHRMRLLFPSLTLCHRHPAEAVGRIHSAVRPQYRSLIVPLSIDTHTLSLSLFLFLSTSFFLGISLFFFLSIVHLKGIKILFIFFRSFLRRRKQIRKGSVKSCLWEECGRYGKEDAIQLGER